MASCVGNAKTGGFHRGFGVSEKDDASCASPRNSGEPMKKGPMVGLGYVGHEILPNYIGISNTPLYY